MVADLAEQAAQSGTFGVGGVLTDETGATVTTMVNRVLDKGRLSDPTAHVERQIVDWYFEESRNNRALPPPGTMTMISSLDPCMMCAGSILAGGFNVVSMNFDDFAGVNYKRDGLFETLPDVLSERAARSFGYCGIEGEYEPSGVFPAFLESGILGAAERDRALRAFTGSLDAIRDNINSSTEEGAPPVNPAVFFSRTENDALLQEVRKTISPCFLAFTGQTGSSPPDVLGSVLLREAFGAASRHGRQNAAALMDTFGNLIMACGGDENISPIRTPFFNLTRSYAQMRNRLRDSGLNILPHPKDSRIVLLRGPGREAADIADLGAFGSTMEGPLPEGRPGLEYIVPSQDPRDLEIMMDRFPPLYRDVIKVRPVQTENKNLVKTCDFALR